MMAMTIVKNPVFKWAEVNSHLGSALCQLCDFIVNSASVSSFRYEMEYPRSYWDPMG